MFLNAPIIKHFSLRMLNHYKLNYFCVFCYHHCVRCNVNLIVLQIITKQTKHSQIILEVLKGMDVKIRAYCHQEQLLLDTLPLLTYLLNPAFRPVINIS